MKRVATEVLFALALLVGLAHGQFARTDIDALVPTILAYPDHVERADGSLTVATPLGNSLKVALDLAQSDEGEVIGVVGATKGVAIGDGKSKWYYDSANKPEGVHGIAIVGLTADATVRGSITIQNRAGASDVNGALCFARLRIESGATAYAAVQTFMQNRTTHGVELVECVLVPNANTYSLIRLHGLSSFSIRDSLFLTGQKEHCVYAEQPQADSEVIGCDMRSPGRCGVQIVNRVESGPPQRGNITIQGNEIDQPRDAFAITVAGASDPDGTVLIAGNTITIDGSTSTAGGLIVYAEGTNIASGKVGSWPVGSTGTEGYSLSNPPPVNLPRVAKCVVRGNKVTGNNLKKQLTCFGSIQSLRIGDRSLFESNNKPAIEINHQGAVGQVVLTFGADYRGLRTSGKVIDVSVPKKPRALTDQQIDALREVIEPTSKP